MKVRPSVKPICEKCKIIKRKGKVMVICPNVKAQTETGAEENNVYTRGWFAHGPREGRANITYKALYNPDDMI